ncbi:J domain-containing protein [Thiobacillus denitrificans]|uniref:J domain-containing protein n=1 Tax=Thiobacillus denitrificans TaxID=36861 RepID=UPI00036BA2EE|nr:DnaJ domain-containing protein [Thiobacillus denitrificans]
MTTTDVAVIVGGLFLGFWIVNSVMGSKPAKKPGPEQTEETRSAEGEAQENTRQSQSQAPQDEPWFRILGVSESAGKEEIASAYKAKIRQYHPDKVASLGPELRELAELKSKQINAAYDYAFKLRG